MFNLKHAELNFPSSRPYLVFFFSMNTNQLDANCAAPASLSALGDVIFKLSLPADEQVRILYLRGAR